MFFYCRSCNRMLRDPQEPTWLLGRIRVTLRSLMRASRVQVCVCILVVQTWMRVFAGGVCVDSFASTSVGRQSKPSGWVVWRSKVRALFQIAWCTTLKSHYRWASVGPLAISAEMLSDLTGAVFVFFQLVKSVIVCSCILFHMNVFCIH